MARLTKVNLKAPKLIEFFKEHGIELSTKKGLFTELSNITLPSGEKACLFDEDAWGCTLYGSDEMMLPRGLGRLCSGDSFTLWLVNHLVDVGENAEGNEDEEYYENDELWADADNDCTDFCKEIKSIFEGLYPDNKSWVKIGELDDLIEEASVLYLDNYWDGEGFDYTYSEFKNGQAFYWEGFSEEEPEIYEDWYWNDLKGFIKLVKADIPATTYTRKNGEWVKI